MKVILGMFILEGTSNSIQFLRGMTTFTAIIYGVVSRFRDEVIQKIKGELDRLESEIEELKDIKAENN